MTAVGVAIVGHGDTASRMLSAARGIVPEGSLGDVVAIDAGEGETPRLSRQLCDAIEQLDRGRGVVMLVDLLGASPCQCVRREGAGHEVVVLSGLNLAMLLKLAGLDRSRLDAHAVAEACAQSGRKAVSISYGGGEAGGEKGG